MEPLEQRLAIAGALALAASGLAIYAPPAQAATLQPGSDSTASTRNAPVVTALDPDPLDDGPALTGPEQAQAEEQTGGSSVDPRQDVPDDAAASNASASSAGTPGEIALFVPGRDDSAPAPFVYLSAPPAHTTSDIPWDWDHTTTPFPQLVPSDLGFLPNRATPPATPPRMQQPLPPGGFHGVQHPTAGLPSGRIHAFDEPAPGDVPAAPTGLSGQGTMLSEISLSWGASASATGYRVERADVLGGNASGGGTISSNFTEVGTTDALQQNFADTGLTEGTTYAYRIIASKGSGDSDPSDTLQVSTLPNAPDNLQVSNVAGTSLTLTWDNHSDAVAASTDSNDGFVVEQSSDAWGSFTQAAMLQGADASAPLSVDVTGLTPDTTYYFRVKATKAGVDSYYSNGQVIVTGPATPTGLAVTGASANEIDLSWNVPDGQYWAIEQSSDNGAFNEITSLSMGTTSYQATGLGGNSAYQFRIRSFSQAGPSDYSPTITGVTAATLSASLISSGNHSIPGEVDLNWDAGQRLDGYVILRASDAEPDNFHQIGTAGPSATSFVDTTVQPGAEYTYRIKSIAGNVSATSSDQTVQTAPIVGGLSAILGPNRDEVDLNWTNLGAVDQVIIERSSTDTEPSSFSEIGSVTPGQDLSSFVDTTVERGATYYYFVEASNAAGVSDPSNIVLGGSVPEAPTGIYASSDSDSVSISWQSAAGAQSYRVLRATYTGGTDVWDFHSYAEVGTTGASETSFTDTSVDPGNLYSYRITATNLLGESDGNDAVTTFPPPPLTGLSAAAISSTEIDLSWNAPGDAVTSYDIVIADADSGQAAASYTADGTSASFAFTSAAPDRSYTFFVTAHTPGGNVSAQISELGEVTASAVSGTQVNIHWSSLGSSDAWVYHIQRSADGAFDDAIEVGTVDDAQTSFPDTTVQGGTTYYYRVFATDPAGESVFSASSPPVTTFPSMPTALIATRSSASEVDLQWDLGAGVNQAAVERSDDQGSTWAAIATLVASGGADGTHYADTTVQPGHAYSYRIDAISNLGSSDPSNAIDVATPWAPPIPNAVSAHEVDVSWIAMPGMQIHILRSTDGPDGTFAEIGTASGDSVFYADTTAEAGATSYYRLVVTDPSTGVRSPAGPSASVLTIPDAPANLNALYAPGGTRVQWSASAGADTYTLWRTTYGPHYGILSEYATQVNTGPGTSFVDPDGSLSSYYLIVATNAAGNSAPIDPVAVTVPTPDSAPGSLHFGHAWTNGIELDWTGGAGGIVHVQEASDGGAFYDIAVVDGSVHQADAYVPFAPEMSYVFRVYGADYADQNPSDFSNTLVLGMPADPANLIPTVASANEIALAWTDNSAGQAQYMVEISSDAWASSSAPVTVDAGVSSYAFQGLAANTTYYFRVTATANGHNSQSITAAALTAPYAPSELQVAGAGFGSVTLNWTSDISVWAQEVQYSSDGFETFATDSVTGGSENDILNGLHQGVTYSFRVRSFNGSWSAASNIVTGTNAWAPPTGLTAAAVSDQRIDLAWSAPVGLASEGARYNLYRSTTDGFAISDAPPIATGISDTSYHDATAQSGTTYYYRVTAVSTGGLESDASDIANDTTAAPTLAAGSPDTLYATEGLAIDPATVIAHFTDDNANDAAANFAATIDWGDGSNPGTGTIVASGDGFDVLGGHAYATVGSQAIAVTIDGGGAEAIASGTAAIADAALSPLPGDALTGTEGASLDDVVVARFTDANPFAGAGDFSATFNWGDGSDLNEDGTPSDSPDLAGYVQADPTLANTFDVLGSHAYAHAGTFNLSAAINDDAGADADGGSSIATATNSATATIADAAITASLVGINPREGLPFDGVVARFRDANLLSQASQFTATVTWTRTDVAPNGTLSIVTEDSPATVVATPGSGLFEVVTQYTPQNNNTTSILVTIHDSGGGVPATAAGVVPIAPSLIVVSPLAVHGVEGQGFGGAVASFTDTNHLTSSEDYKAVISWGTGQVDGNVSGGGGQFTITPSMPLDLKEEGSLFLNFRVQRGTHLAAGFGIANTDDASLSMDKHYNISGMAVDSYTFQNALLAHFSDNGPNGSASTYGADITWGDNTNGSAGTVAQDPNGGSDVYGTHTYHADNTWTDENGNEQGCGENWAFSVAVVDKGGASANDGPLETRLKGMATITGSGPFTGTGTGTGQISAAAGGSGPVAGTGGNGGGGSGPDPTSGSNDGITAQGQSASGSEGANGSGRLATFTDAQTGNDPGSYSAEITFADQSPITGTVSSDGSGGFVVNASYNFAEEGNHAGTLVITQGSRSVSVQPVVHVADAPLSAQSQGPYASVQSGHSTGDLALATFTDADTGDMDGTHAADYTANIDWGDGNVSPGVISFSGGSFHVTGSHTYDLATADQTHTITTTIADTAGISTASASDSINVCGTQKASVSITAAGTGQATDPLPDHAATSAQFIIHRSGGDMTLPLTVYYRINANGGEATDDYPLMDGSVEIPANQNDVTIDIPTDAEQPGEAAEEDQVVTARIDFSSGRSPSGNDLPYQSSSIAGPISATVTIHEAPPPTLPSVALAWEGATSDASWDDGAFISLDAPGSGTQSATSSDPSPSNGPTQQDVRALDLVLTPQTLPPGAKVTLSYVRSGQGDVRVWEETNPHTWSDPQVPEYTQILGPPSGVDASADETTSVSWVSPSAPGTGSSASGSFYPDMVWVEGTQASNENQDVEFDLTVTTPSHYASGSGQQTPALQNEADPGPGGQAKNAPPVKATLGALEINPVVSGIEVTAKSPLNTIFNPAAIVIDPQATADTAAQIYLSGVMAQPPTDPMLKQNDPRIDWSFAPDPDRGQIRAGSAHFLKDARGVHDHGPIALVVGDSAGRILVVATNHQSGTVIAKYEAVVVNLKQVSYRVQILKGETIESALYKQPAAVLAYIQQANVFLRQAGVQLVPTTVPLAAKDMRIGTASVAGVDQVYTVNTGDDSLVDVPVANPDPQGSVLPPAIRNDVSINQSANILNIVFVHQIGSFDANGVGETDFGIEVGNPLNAWEAGAKYNPLKHADATFLDVTYQIDNAAPVGDYKMRLAGEHKSAGNVPNQYATLIENDNRKVPLYGETLAHETLHYCGIMHRNAWPGDGLSLPEYGNLMSENLDKNGNQKPTDYLHDVDLAQAIAAHPDDLKPPGYTPIVGPYPTKPPTTKPSP